MSAHGLHVRALEQTDQEAVQHVERQREQPIGCDPAEDSRSQLENKNLAVRRLRSAIALEIREPLSLTDYVPSPRLAAFVAAGTAPLGARTRLTGDYWAAYAELLDLLVAGDLEIGTTAARLGITTGALSKLILHDEHVGRAVNDLRRSRRMRPLREW